MWYAKKKCCSKLPRGISIVRRKTSFSNQLFVKYSYAIAFYLGPFLLMVLVAYLVELGKKLQQRKVKGFVPVLCLYGT